MFIIPLLTPSMGSIWREHTLLANRRQFQRAPTCLHPVEPSWSFISSAWGRSRSLRCSKVTCSSFHSVLLQTIVRFCTGSVLSLQHKQHICSSECPSEPTNLSDLAPRLSLLNTLNPFKVKNSLPGLLATTGILLLARSGMYSLVPSFRVAFGDKQIFYLCHRDKGSLFFPSR